MTVTFATVERHAQRIRENSPVNNPDVVGPGQPLYLNSAAAIGDGVWQGDLGIEIVAGLPDGYVTAPVRLQLVPGNTTGSRHCLLDPSTVTEFALPQGWSDNQDYDGLRGPYFQCVKDTTIPHPIHGPAIIAAGHCIALRYQRNLDEETKRERRAAD